MPTKKPQVSRCKRRHLMVGDNVQIERRYYTPKIPAGGKAPRRRVSKVAVCRACISARAKARASGRSLKDLRYRDA